MDELARQLRALREARGWSQDRAAEAVGVDRTTLAKWELGRVLPKGHHLIRWARTFNCTLVLKVG